MYKELNMTIVKRRATHNDKLLFGYTNRVFFKCSCIIELIKSVEEKRLEVCQAFYHLLNKFNKFNNTGAWVLDSILSYDIKTNLKSHFWC